VRVEVSGQKHSWRTVVYGAAGLAAGDYSLTVQAAFSQEGTRTGMLEAVLKWLNPAKCRDVAKI